MKELIRELKKRKFRKVMIQLPEGLKTRSQEIVSEMESKGIEVLLNCDPNFGACDIRDNEAKNLGCDVIVNIGHNDFGVNTVLPVIYYPYRIKANPVPILKKEIKKLKQYKSIGLVSSAQYVLNLKEAKKFLEEKGKKVFIGKSNRGDSGQILGCDWSAAKAIEDKVDCFLFIGSGRFHPLGLARFIEKPSLSLNFDIQKIEDLSKEAERIERVKAFNIMKARDAKKFGILLTTKKGQGNVKVAENVKKKLEKSGKKVWILVMDMIAPEKIMGLDLDVLINVACPRMDEDFRIFRKPILNPSDVEKIID